MSKENPAGSAPQETPGQASETKGTAQAPAAPAKILDKFDTPEALAESYKQLESKLGAQGAEVGTLKQQNQFLMEQMQKQQAMKQEPEAPAGPSYEEQMAEIQQQIEDGDLSVAEALVKSNTLTAQQATAMAEKKFQEFSMNKEAANVQAKFMQENPGFEEAQKSGVLETIKQAYPGLHDDFSAFFQFQAMQNAQALQAYQAEAQQQIAMAGKTAELEAGKEVTETVLTKPGDGVRDTRNPKPLTTNAELRASMLKAIGG